MFSNFDVIIWSPTLDMYLSWYKYISFWLFYCKHYCIYHLYHRTCQCTNLLMLQSYVFYKILPFKVPINVWETTDFPEMCVQYISILLPYSQDSNEL